MMGEGAWMGGGMWVLWILLIAIVVVLVKVLAAAGGSGAPRARRESPLEILEARYARGEIDEEEFKRRRRDLES